MVKRAKAFIKQKRLDWHRDRVLVAGHQERALDCVVSDAYAPDWERQYAEYTAARWNKIRKRHLGAIRRLNQEK